MLGIALICLALALTALVAAQPQAVPRTATSPGVLSPAFPYASPEEVGLSAAALERLADQVASWVTSDDLVGAEILIVKRRKIVLHEAVGWSDRETGVPLERGAIHRIASATKPVTGTAIMLLLEDGKLALDDRISEYLPSFDNARSRQITIRQLMTHTGGFGEETYSRSYRLYSSLRELVDDIGRAGPQHPPGAFLYSDLGTNTLGAVVEEVSGLPLERFLEERIFEPLGMSDTHGRFIADAPWPARLTSAYIWWPDVGRLSKYSDRNLEWRPPFLMPAWGLYTTAMDYARFLSLWLNQGQHDDDRLFSAQTAQAALRQDVEPLYAMQWETWGSTADGKMPRIFGHSGATGPKAWVVPDEDLIVVYFTQAVHHSCREQLSMIAGLLGISETLSDHTLYGRWRAPASEAALTAAGLTQEQRDRYVGWYDVAGRVARVWDDSGVLALTRDLKHPPGNPSGNPGSVPCGSEFPPFATVHLVPLGEHRFVQGRYYEGQLEEVYWPDVPLKFSFEGDDVTGYDVPYSVVKESATRYRLRPPSLPFASDPLSPEQRDRFLGVYAVVEAPWSFRILEIDGKLVADWAGSLERLVHGGGNLFKALEREVFYFFSTLPDGNARDVTIRFEDGSVVTARLHDDGHLVEDVVSKERLVSARQEHIDEIVRAHMADRRIPGASIAVVTEDGVAMTSAYGTAVIQHDVPAKVDTVYEIASLTKQFTAAAVLLLCDEGKLDLDDPITRYVESAPEAWRGITLRHLLTHTAGLAPEDEEFASLKGDWRRYSTRELMLASAIQDPIRADPGTRFDYSSGGYFLAALAVEMASGMTYRDFMRRRIFEPLGMDRTLIQDELRIIPGEARGYSIKDGELVNIWRDAVEEVAGGWGMFSNVPDLIRWDRALRDGELLSAKSYREMLTPVELAGGERFRYGLGWWLPERNGIPYQYHNGTTGPEILRIPSRGLTVIALTNLGRSPSVGSGEANPWGLAGKIAGVLVPEFALETRDLPLSDQELAVYAGRWRFGYGEARLFGRDGHLWIEDANGTDAMLYQGNDTFGFEGDAERLVFDRSSEGEVVAARWVDETWPDDPGERLEPEQR